MKKKTRVWAAVLGTVVAAVGALYVYHGVYYQSHFLPGTRIEGIELGRLTPAQAKKKLKTHFTTSNYQLYDKQNQLVEVSGKQLGVSQNAGQYLKSLLKKQNSWSLTDLVQAASVHSESLVNINEQKLNQYVEQTLPTLNKARRTSEDAKIIKTADSYEIKPEVVGNVFDQSAVTKTIKQHIENGQRKIQLSTTYEQPAVTKTNTKLRHSS